MAKTAILSNGNLNIGLNEFGLVSDFYFPDNGYENHTLGRDLFHRVGIKIGDEFSWLQNGDWQFSSEYFEDALISKTEAINNNLQIKITYTMNAIKTKNRKFLKSSGLFFSPCSTW